ncbi:MAG: septum formation protein Maf [Deltaproteobacteria bacterium]|nr:septum formation protein Maf [Deltaproteobacteria bacterium]MBN2673986.1 septum formation protein Maf [Deltaproteobacteria bacterium]
MVLASQSPRRKTMFAEQRIPVRIVAAHIDETRLPEEAPLDYVKRISGAKAMKVASQLATEQDLPFIVAADTIVLHDGDILSKPSNEEDAFRMLRRLSDATHSVITGWTVGKTGESWTVSHTETRVTFHRLSDSEIQSYIRTGEPNDKAGAYAIQGIGGYLVKEIAGDFYNVVGLPISQVVRALIQHGAIKGFLQQ